MLMSTHPFQAYFSLACPRCWFPVTPVVTSGVPLSPACQVLLARLCLSLLTPRSYLTSSLRVAEMVAQVSWWWVQRSLHFGG